MSRNAMRPVHPGEVFLEDYIEPMGMSVRALSLALQAAYDLRVAEMQSAKPISRETEPLAMAT